MLCMVIYIWCSSSWKCYSEARRSHTNVADSLETIIESVESVWANYTYLIVPFGNLIYLIFKYVFIYVKQYPVYLNYCWSFQFLIFVHLKYVYLTRRSSTKLAKKLRTVIESVSSVWPKQLFHCANCIYLNVSLCHLICLLKFIFISVVIVSSRSGLGSKYTRGMSTKLFHSTIATFNSFRHLPTRYATYLTSFHYLLLLPRFDASKIMLIHLMALTYCHLLAVLFNNTLPYLSKSIVFIWNTFEIFNV